MSDSSQDFKKEGGELERVVTPLSLENNRLFVGNSAVYGSEQFQKTAEDPDLLQPLSDFPHTPSAHSHNRAALAGLMHGLAHELNNPVGMILQYLENIIRRLDPHMEKNQGVAQDCGIDLERVQQYLESRDIIRFLENIRGAGTRITDLLAALSHAQIRLDHAVLQPVCMMDITDHIYTHELATHAVHMVCLYQQADQEPLTREQTVVHACPKDMELLVQHIIENAIQAERMEGIESKIWIQMVCNNGMLEWSVQDNGIGMDDALCSRIFDPFFTTKSGGIGRGLGLWLCHNIIVAHQGNIWVESGVGKGSRVVFRLPVWHQPG